MFFDSIAHAMGATGGDAAAGGNPLMSMLPLVLMFGIFYFLLIRPQQKKAKEHKNYLANLRKGEIVLTGSGMYGRIASIEEDIIHLDLGETKVMMHRNFVAESKDVPKEVKKWLDKGDSK